MCPFTHFFWKVSQKDCTSGGEGWNRVQAQEECSGPTVILQWHTSHHSHYFCREEPVTEAFQIYLFLLPRSTPSSSGTSYACVKVKISYRGHPQFTNNPNVWKPPVSAPTSPCLSSFPKAGPWLAMPGSPSLWAKTMRRCFESVSIESERGNCRKVTGWPWEQLSGLPSHLVPHTTATTERAHTPQTWKCFTLLACAAYNSYCKRFICGRFSSGSQNKTCCH